MKAKAYIFDVFGTIVDWRSGVAQACAPFLNSANVSLDPLEFADRWRDKYQPSMERIRSGDRNYVALDTLHRENLDMLLEELDLSEKFAESTKMEINRAWEKLPPWQDSVPGLGKIKKSAIIAPCSNGSIALMTRLAKFGQLPWDCILGAEIAQTYKPDPGAYLKSVKALGLSPNDVCMVAAHNNDLEAASEIGLQTAFIPRPTEHGPGQTTDLSPSRDWDQIVSTLTELK